MAKISQIKVQDKVYDVNDATKAVSQVLSSENLNDIQTPGFYSAPGSNTTTNKPTGVDAFGLIVSHNAIGAFYTQVLYSANTNPGLAYRRTCTSGTWTAWSQDKYTDTTYSAATSSTLGLVKTGSNITNTSGTISLTNGNVISALGYTPPTTNTTYGSATTTNLGLIRVGTTIVRESDGKYNVVTSKLTVAGTSVAGLMSADDKQKLDHIDKEANKYSLPKATTGSLGGVIVGSNLSVDSSGKISATDTTYSNMTAATSTADGKAGLVPAPGKGKQGQYLRGDGTWATPTNTTYGMATTSTFGLVKIGSGINVSSGVISIGTATTSANGLMTKDDKSKLSGLSNTPALAMGVAGYVPGTPSVSDTSNSNRYLSGGANGKGAWRALPSVTWDTSGLGKTFKNYKSGAAVPTGYGTAATAPTVNAITSTSGRYYGVENDSNNRLFVNVPWTDTVGVTGTSVSKIRVLSPTQYNNLTTKSNLELYFILE